MDKLGINLLNHHEHTALIVRRDKIQKISYRDLLKQVLKASLFIESEQIDNKYTIIGIHKEKSLELVTLSLGIIEADYPFSYITNDDIFNNEFYELGIEYFFSSVQINLGTIELRKTLLICGTTLYFYKTKNPKEPKKFNCADNEMNKICYRIATSGTTGKKKHIHVTYNSIYPNIKSLSQIFKLDHRDVILSASPITFDVFIIDLFLALYSGSCLLITDDKHRFDTSLYSKNNCEESVTFLQMTPTIFQQYGLENIQSKILHTESSLKYLVLGGEEFPSTKEVCTWQNWDDANRKRIFNIYGITELSCWSLLHEVTKEDLEYGKVPLGNPLDSNTLPAFYPHTGDVEELILTSSTRVNFFADKDWDKKLGTNGVFAYITNDLVKKIDGKIYWHGRLNDIVKRFGERVDLKKIEDVAAEIIQPVSCIMIKKRIALFYQSDHDNISQLLSNHMRLKLKKSEFPDDIKRIDFLPTCDHGKVSKKKLKELYKDIIKEDNRKESAEEIFLETLNQMFNLKLEKPFPEIPSDEHDGVVKRAKHDIDSTFQQIGGSSFDALRIVMKIEDRMNSMSNALLPKLLDNQNTIKDVFAYLKGLNLKVKNGDAENIVNYVNNTSRYKNFSIQKKFDLKKCVDSTPSLISINDQKNYIVVGSHSGELITIDADNLSIMSNINLNDRIECEASQLKDSAIVVGCYDGYLYCVDILSKEENSIKFKYNSGAMIKSKPLIVNNEFIIFGNYNYEENLRCISVKGESQELKWSKLVGMSGIMANILQIDAESFIVCTLDGEIQRAGIFDGKSIWNRKFEYPIFSSPQKLAKINAIIFAEVMKKVHCIDYDGNSLWMFETDGHIFSSFLFNIFDESSVKITFGCHDNKLRCLNFCSKESKNLLEWETNLQSQIYGTPKIIKVNSKDLIISCSTSGYVNFVNSLNGKIENSLKLPGEVFSTPLVYKDKIFIGCRDNYVYCISFNH